MKALVASTLLAVTAATATGAAVPADAHQQASGVRAAAPVCRYGAGWGTGVAGNLRDGTPGAAQPRVAVRTGTHPCFDRVVLEYTPYGRAPAGHSASYVETLPPRTIYGQTVPYRGRAVLEFSIYGSADLGPQAGRVLAAPRGYRELIDVRAGAYYRAVQTGYLSLQRKAPYRIFDLKGPGSHRRIVIDVANRS